MDESAHATWSGTRMVPLAGADSEQNVCDECLFEAWERMTYGGVVNEKGPGVYVTADCDMTCIKTTILSHVTR